MASTTVGECPELRAPMMGAHSAFMALSETVAFVMINENHGAHPYHAEVKVRSKPSPGNASRPPPSPSRDQFALRALVMGCGMISDCVVNYPMWIAAKRVGVGLPPFPSSAFETYKGVGVLFGSLGPTVIIEDSVTTALQATTSGTGKDMGKESGSETAIRKLACAAASGVVAAFMITSQVEHLITRAHASSVSMGTAFRSVYHKHGWRYILAPPGMAMMAGREVPFAAALLYVRPTLSAYLHPDPDGGVCQDPLWKRVGREVASGVITALVCGPVSHVPSVIAAYQQGHGTSIRESVSQLVRLGGYSELWRGLAHRTFSLAGTFIVVPFTVSRLCDHFHLEDG